MTATRVRVVSGDTAVREMLEALPAAMRPTAFQHPGWIAAWLASSCRGRRRIVAVQVECAASGRPLFALPLVLDTFGGASFWAPLDLGVCDYNASYAAPDFRPSPADMKSIWKRIVAALPDDAAFLMIDKLPTAIGERCEPLLAVPGLRRSHVARHPLRLDADFATLRSTRFSQTTMRSLTRKRRKLERKGRFSFHVATGAEAAEPLGRLLAWRGERYGERREVDDFYRGLTAAGDPVRVMWLALDGEPISAAFGLVEPTAFRLLAIGHEERFKNWSPGLLVIEDAIAWAIDHGLAEFDFTIGSEAYKLEFGVTAEPMWLIADQFGPHGAALLRLMLARNAIAKKLKRWIDPNGPRAAATPRPRTPPEPAVIRRAPRIDGDAAGAKTARRPGPRLPSRAIRTRSSPSPRRRRVAARADASPTAGAAAGESVVDRPRPAPSGPIGDRAGGGSRPPPSDHSTVTDLARLRGWSTSVPMNTAAW